MTEREMEDLLWEYTDLFLGEPLTRFRRQQSGPVGRSDLIFQDAMGRFLVVELKRGRLPREALFQLEDYFGTVKKAFPNTPVEKMVVANVIPEERRLACEQYNIVCREIPEQRFRDVAHHVGYVFRSEAMPPRGAPEQCRPNLETPQPSGTELHVPRSKRQGSRELWSERGFDAALSVVDGCFEILRDEIDSSLKINYDALNNIRLERAGRILHCLRFNPVAGALRVSGVAPDRGVWMQEKFKACGLTPVLGYNEKRARVLVRPDQVRSCRDVLREFFIDCGLRPVHR